MWVSCIVTSNSCITKQTVYTDFGTWLVMWCIAACLLSTTVHRSCLRPLFYVSRCRRAQESTTIDFIKHTVFCSILVALSVDCSKYYKHRDMRFDSLLRTGANRITLSRYWSTIMNPLLSFCRSVCPCVFGCSFTISAYHSFENTYFILH